MMASSIRLLNTLRSASLRLRASGCACTASNVACRWAYCAPVSKLGHSISQRSHCSVAYPALRRSGGRPSSGRPAPDAGSLPSFGVMEQQRQLAAQHSQPLSQLFGHGVEFDRQMVEQREHGRQRHRAVFRPLRDGPSRQHLMAWRNKILVERQRIQQRRAVNYRYQPLGLRFAKPRAVTQGQIAEAKTDAVADWRRLCSSSRSPIVICTGWRQLVPRSRSKSWGDPVLHRPDQRMPQVVARMVLRADEFRTKTASGGTVRSRWPDRQDGPARCNSWRGGTAASSQDDAA